MQHPDTGALVVDRPPAAPRSLRIACVTETYPPEVNGVALTVARIVEGLHTRQHDVQLVRPRQDGSAPAAEALFSEVLVRGLPIPRYPHLRMGLPARRVLQQLWSRQRPDVVHIATEGPLGWSALQAARRLQLPVCSDFRTNFHAYSGHYRLGWLRSPIMAYLRTFHNQTGCTMVPTAALQRELEGCGLRDLVVVGRGVDVSRFDPALRSAALRASWGVGDADLVMGCVGRLAPEKNLDALLAAFAAVRAQQPRARLVLVGDGPLRAALQARCPDAVFAGQRHGADLAAHYASLDLFLFPSLTETFGNVTTEALASGLPVLAFDYAGAGQVIRSGDNGVLVPFGDTPAFVKAATLLAADAAQRAALRSAARRSAADLGWDRVVERFEAVLGQVIASAALVGACHGWRLDRAA